MIKSRNSLLILKSQYRLDAQTLTSSTLYVITKAAREPWSAPCDCARVSWICQRHEEAWSSRLQRQLWPCRMLAQSACGRQRVVRLPIDVTNADPSMHLKDCCFKIVDSKALESGSCSCSSDLSRDSLTTFSCSTRALSPTPDWPPCGE